VEAKVHTHTKKIVKAAAKAKKVENSAKKALTKAKKVV
jgi:hypothetical protein